MILLLLACAGSKGPAEGAPSTGTPDATDTGVTVVVDTGEVSPTDTGIPPLPTVEETLVQPTLSATEVADRLTTALGNVPDPTEILETYQFLMGQGDATCPGPGLNIVDTWLYGCDATTGYSYAGVTDWVEELFEEDGLTGDINSVAGDFWIDTPEGHQMEGGGHSVIFRNDWVWIGEIAGSWRWDAGSDWLQNGFSGALTMEYISFIALNLRGAADINGTHIAASELSIELSCGGPTGGLALRDPEGGWHKMTFSDCHPCAPVVFEGQDLGEACVDFTGVLAAVGARL